MQAIYSRITGTGHYVPENVVTNEHLAQCMPTSADWILERTGIRERRFFEAGKDTVANMAAHAARKALAQANLEAKQVELIVFATTTPEYYFPGSGVLLQRELGIPGIPAIDIKMQCTGFIYALSIADQFIRTGTYKNALVVGSEIQSNAVEFSERGRNMAVIFADGAGAVVLQATTNPNHRLLKTQLYSDGQFAEALCMKHPGSLHKQRLTHTMLEDGSLLPYMNGPLVFKHAVQKLSESVTSILSACGYSLADLDLLIPHQANLRISEYISENLGLDQAKVYNNIQHYGNTSAASIPIALSEAVSHQAIQPNQLLCLAAFGSGFTWASALLRW